MGSTMHDQEALSWKLVPLILVTLTSSIAITVLAIRHARYTGGFYLFVTSNRDTIGLMVQVISAVLGACQILAITCIMNFSTRLRFQNGRPVTFRWIKFWTAITAGSIPGIRSRFSIRRLSLIIVLILSLKLLAAVWAGALTPLVDVAERNEGFLPVATYPLEALPYWQGSFRRGDDGTVDMSLYCTWAAAPNHPFRGGDVGGGSGIVSACPALDVIGALLGSLSTASSGTAAAPRAHARVDSMGWSYLGRSYGMGSSPGLAAAQKIPFRSAPIASVNYTESGYESVVSCEFNATSNYTLSADTYYTDFGDLATQDLETQTYIVSGTLPNSIPGHVEEYLMTSNSWQDGRNNLAWSALSNNGKNMLAVAAEGWYEVFNQTQCKVEFNPRQFSVFVNTTTSVISVTPINDVNAQDIEPTRQYATSVFYGLEQISRISGSTVVGTLGTPLEHNMHALVNNSANLLQSEKTKLALQSLEDSVTALLDDLFVANAQSQIHLMQNSTDTPLTITYRAIKLGSDKYIFAVLVTNLLVLLLTLVEMTRTRVWRRLTVFDYTDIQNVTVAASAGGTSISTSFPNSFGTDIISEEERVRVRLKQEGRRNILISAYENIALGPSDDNYEGRRFMAASPIK